MYLVQILVPLYDDSRRRFPASHYEALRAELTERFGGLTSYTRAPAEGLWEDGSGTQRDDIVVHEVMTETLDREWWAGLRARLEQLFVQDELVVRALRIERL